MELRRRLFFEGSQRKKCSVHKRPLGQPKEGKEKGSFEKRRAKKECASKSQLG
jgi:hypothetical protein